MVILGFHTNSRDHVAAELARYAPLGEPGLFPAGSGRHYGEHVAGMPRTGADWSWNNPKPAIAAFLTANPDFEYAPLPRPSTKARRVPDCSHHPQGWLRRKGPSAIAMKTRAAYRSERVYKAVPALTRCRRLASKCML